MQISSNISKEEIKKLQKNLYEYFKTGYAFEDFLKEYLLKMGLDEVEVTRRSRDGGIDLTAIRKGVGDFSEIDITHYYIQAKRYALKNKINVRFVRELKGTIPFGYKGMFITTSNFTKDAVKEASNDPSKPVVLINGAALVTSLIDNQIGFVFKPIFSSKQMDLFVNKGSSDTSIHINVKNDIVDDYIEKTITANDIRARIISIPSTVMKQFDIELKSVDVVVNDKDKYLFNINKGRNYFSCVTALLRDYNMLSDEGVVTPKQSKWKYDAENKTVKIYIEE